MEIENCAFCFTDSICCSWTHPRASCWGQIQVLSPFQYFPSEIFCIRHWEALRLFEVLGQFTFRALTHWALMVINGIKLPKAPSADRGWKQDINLSLSFVPSCFSGPYRQSCLTVSVKLLDKLCKGVKPESYTQNFPNVPLMCMNILALVTDFVHRNAPKVCDKCVGTENANVSVSLTGFRYRVI